MDRMFLTIEDTPFAQLRRNINQAIQDVITNMQECDVETASISVKITIDLASKEVADPSSVNINNTREALVPTIKHKVTALLSIKDEKKGEFTDNCEIVHDSSGVFILQKITGGQMSMLDEDSAANYQYGEGHSEPDSLADLDDDENQDADGNAFDENEHGTGDDGTGEDDAGEDDASDGTGEDDTGEDSGDVPQTDPDALPY